MTRKQKKGIGLNFILSFGIQNFRYKKKNLLTPFAHQCYVKKEGKMGKWKGFSAPPNPQPILLYYKLCGFQTAEFTILTIPSISKHS